MILKNEENNRPEKIHLVTPTPGHRKSFHDRVPVPYIQISCNGLNE